MRNALSHLILCYLNDNSIGKPCVWVRICVWRNIEMWARNEEVFHCSQSTTWWQCIFFLQLKPNIFQCKHILLCKVCSNPHQPNLKEIWPIKHPFFLAPLHESINVIYIKPSIWRNVVVGMVFLLHACVPFLILVFHGFLVFACST